MKTRNIFTVIVSLALSIGATAQTLFPVMENEVRISNNQGGMPIGVLDASDYFGTRITNLGDLDGDGVNDMAVSAHLDDDGLTNAGCVYILFMNPDGTIKSRQKISATVGGFTGPLGSGDAFGIGLDNIGDLDGDGVIDLAVSGYLNDDGGVNKGALWILFLNSDGTVKAEQKISATTGGFAGPLDASDYFGRDVAGIGDVNGDGHPDIAVGAGGDDDGGSNVGAVYIIMLNADGTVNDEQKISALQGGLIGVPAGRDYFGNSITGLGDLDNDGVPDIAIGAAGDDEGGLGAGTVYTILLNSDGTVKSQQLISESITGKCKAIESNWYFGAEVANAGDIDGDGIMDLMVGAYYATGSHVGYFYLITMNTDGSPKTFRRYGEGYGWSYTGLTSTSSLSRSLASLGDLNGDGFTDYAAGIKTGRNYGGVMVMFGDGTAESPANPGTAHGYTKITQGYGGYGATGLDDYDNFGFSVAAAGDIDGDGVEDMIAGAFRDDDGGANRGAVEILMMNTDGTVSSKVKISSLTTNFTTALSDEDRFGRSCTSLGDLDGDGNIDIAVGAYLDDDGGLDQGAVYILFLNGSGGVISSQKISATVGGLAGPLALGDNFGTSVANIGDVDNDGIIDLAVGASLANDVGTDRGAVYILLMNANGTVKNEQKITTGTGGLSGYGFANGDAFGVSVCGMGDINGDGVEDIGVGAPKYGTDVGIAFILMLNSTGTLSAVQAISTGDLNSELSQNDLFGYSVANVGDLDGDGINDIAIGAPVDKTGEYKSGAIYMITLDNTGEVVTHQTINSINGNRTAIVESTDYFGRSVAFMGDLNGDGYIDLAAGVDGDDDAGIDRGGVYVLSLFSTTKFVDVNSYARLTKRLDGGYHQTFEGILRVKYDEEYELTALEDLTYNVYDFTNQVVVSDATVTENIIYGSNWMELDFSCAGTPLDQAYYILEVINKKEEKWYLRFHTNVICSSQN